MKYYVQLGEISSKTCIKDMFIYPIDKEGYRIYEIDKDTFYELIEYKKDHNDIFLNLENHNNNIEDTLKNKDFNVAKFNNILREKNFYTQELTRKINDYIKPTVFIDSYEFAICNNELMSNGFFITNDNREEKYLEILQLDDNEKLIDILEKYLITLDNLNKYSYNLNLYRNFQNQIDEANTVEEIKEIMERVNLQFK
jgi:hypothetical protein